jgi:hypothetical protein
MLTWLRNRPANKRRAARPADKPATNSSAVAKEIQDGIVDVYTPDQLPQPQYTTENELPPPFFADTDPAFLDLTEPTTTELPPPLPEISFTTSQSQVQTATLNSQLAAALRELPPWPKPDSPDRTEQLLNILRQLDRIAGDVCSALESDRQTESSLSQPGKSR